MHAPTVTVGLPVYEGERHLQGAIDSILSQSFKDFELVISDNGSTDATPEIVAAAAAADERVRSFRVPTNRGASWNFNNVLHQARGRLFKWASHDDQLMPTMLERCVTASRDDPDAVLWYPLTTEIDDDGRPVGPVDDRLPLDDPEPHVRLERMLTLYEGSNPIFGVLDTATLRTTRLLDDFHSSDVVLIGELAMRGRFVEIDERLFLRRWEFRSTESRTREEVDEWFNPDTRRSHVFVRSRLFREMTRSILRAPLEPSEKLRCLRALGSTWGRRYGRTMAGELKMAARLALGARPPADY